MQLEIIVPYLIQTEVNILEVKTKSNHRVDTLGVPARAEVTVQHQYRGDVVQDISIGVLLVLVGVALAECLEEEPDLVVFLFPVSWEELL